MKIKHELDATHLGCFNDFVATRQIPDQGDMLAAGEVENGGIAITHLHAVQESIKGIVLMLVGARLVKDEIHSR